MACVPRQRKTFRLSNKTPVFQAGQNKVTENQNAERRTGLASEMNNQTESS
jgi:hypothetical protein